MAGEGLYRIVVIGVLHGQLIENGFWFADTAAGPNLSYELSLQLLMQDWDTYIKDPWLDFTSVEYRLLQLAGATMLPANGPVHFIDYQNVFGVQQAESLPSHDAGLISWRTGLGGRSNRGRSYIAGAPRIECTGSQLINPSLSRLVHLADMHLNRWGNTGTSGVHLFGVFSRKLGYLPDPILPTQHIYSHLGFRRVSQAIVRQLVATQRHRKVGRGN